MTVRKVWKMLVVFEWNRYPLSQTKVFQAECKPTGDIPYTYTLYPYHMHTLQAILSHFIRIPPITPHAKQAEFKPHNVLKQP